MATKPPRKGGSELFYRDEHGVRAMPELHDDTAGAAPYRGHHRPTCPLRSPASCKMRLRSWTSTSNLTMFWDMTLAG